jgi:cephalosporin hydroxylase
MSEEFRGFREQRRVDIERMALDKAAREAADAFITVTAPHKYAYNFSWMGRPIIQFPQDMMAMQEIVWTVRPDLIVEAGIAHGGSVLYYASLLELMGHGEVIGIDVEIRPWNREAIEAHPMSKRLKLIEGSSVDPATVEQVRTLAADKRVIVVLDSNHAHDHVLAELEAYAPLVCEGGYCVVMDTIIEAMPASFYPGDRPWGVGNNPGTAVREFLQSHPEFEADSAIDHQLLISVAPGGYLRRRA